MSRIDGPGVHHGHLDHLAYRTTTAEFRLIFQAHLEGTLPTMKEFEVQQESEQRTELLTRLADSGVKHTPEDVVAIEEIGGRIVFLETGNTRAGLNHILAAHEADFAAKGVSADQIPELVMAALRQGKEVGVQGKPPGRPIYEIEFNGQTLRVAISVGSNGFIVGANPTSNG